MTRPVRKKPDRGRGKKKPEPPICRRRNPRGRSTCMRANTRLITAPRRTEIPGSFGIEPRRQRSSCLFLGRGRDRLGWSRPPSWPRSLSLPPSLGVMGPHPYLLPRHTRAAVASRLGAKPRQLNPEIRQCRAGQQSRWPPQSFSAPPSRHRPRPCIVAPAMPIRRPIIRGAPSPPVIRVAPSPPAIARRPVAHLAAPLVCHPVLLASRDTTPGDERGWMG
jgi:hypothetical protein